VTATPQGLRSPNPAGSGRVREKGQQSPPGLGHEKTPALRGKPPQDPGRTPVNHEMANNPKCTDIDTSIVGDEGDDQFPVTPTSRFPRTGALEAGLLHKKLAESGKRNLGSPSQDKKDALFLRNAINAARTLLRTARAELREFDSKGDSREWVGGIVAHTDAAYEHIDSLLTKKGNLLVNVSAQEPVTNKKSKK